MKPATKKLVRNTVLALVAAELLFVAYDLLQGLLQLRAMTG